MVISIYKVKIIARARRLFPFIILFILMLGIWQIIVALTHIPSFLLPSPALVVSALLNPKWQWFHQAWATTIEIFGGFLLAALVGIFLGIVITWSDFSRRAVMPFLVFLNSLPKIAIAPLFIIWVGYGIMPNILIAFISAFFPVAVNTATGITEIEPDMLNLAKALRVPRWKRFVMIRIPNALPYIFSGLKIASTMAVIGAIVGEFIASTRGLAAIIIMAKGTLATEAIFAALVWISALGLGLYGLVVVLQKIFMPWAKIEHGV